MRLVKKPATKAEQFLGILGDCFPDGIPISVAAEMIYGFVSRETKDRVRDLARTLRKWGYAVYSVNGIYCLCDNNPPKFVAASQYRHGFALGGAAAYIQMLMEAGKTRPEGEFAHLLDSLKDETCRALEDMVRRLKTA
ncbi:MAG: hypothetical protein ACPLSY_03225 [Moorellaceae bacterium]